MRRIPLAVLALALAACAPARVQPASVPDPSEQPVPVLAGCSGETPLRAGGAIRPPTRVHNVHPEFPAEARQSGTESAVVIEIIVDCVGNVGSAHVLHGVPALNDAALTAVKQWRYVPTLLNGRPMPVIMAVSIVFSS